MATRMERLAERMGWDLSISLYWTLAVQQMQRICEAEYAAEQEEREQRWTWIQEQQMQSQKQEEAEYAKEWSKLVRLPSMQPNETDAMAHLEQRRKQRESYSPYHGHTNLGQAWDNGCAGLCG